MEYMRKSEKFWETFILPEIAFSCFRFALLSSWPKFWMDQFFWENCAGTPVQNFPTILKTLKMMRMIIIRCCCICFLWICFEIVLFLLISNSVFFVWLCVLLCADVMHRNLASHFFYHPIFVLVTCAPPLCNQPSWLLHFQQQHFFRGEGDFLPTYTYRLANPTQQVEIDFSYIDVSPLLNVLIP